MILGLFLNVVDIGDWCCIILEFQVDVDFITIAAALFLTLTSFLV